MKRTTLAALLLALALLLTPPLPQAGAAALAPPDVTPAGTEETETDTRYRFRVCAPEAAAYEAYRQSAYASVSADYTDEQIAKSDQSWLLYPVSILCEAAAGDGEYTPVRAFAPEREGEITLSLIRDILPALSAAGQYTEAGFSFTLRFSVAAAIKGTDQPLSDHTGAFAFACPATVPISYVLPARAQNPNPAFVFAPFTAALPLENPTMPGGVFAGWETANGSFVDQIRPGDLPVTLFARFTPCVYRISYILTTRPGYVFQRVNNDVNPKSYESGVAAALYDVKAPSGYVFAGWYESEDFSGAPVTAIGETETGDRIFYARWQTTDEAELEAARAAGWGDLTNDGEITAADARLALRVAVGLETLPPARLARADFAKLGRLNADSARTLLRIAVGLETLPQVLRAYGLLK